MLDFLNESNWWCLFALLLFAFVLGWFLSKWVNNSKYKRTERQKEALRVQTPIANTTFTSNDPAITETPASNIKAVKTRDRNGVPAEAKKPTLNFDNFGKADPSQKDNLKLISGVGPFIEGKLNSIGIYTFDQISKFSKEDIDAVTQLIQFFPGRIERDNWKQQAIDLKN
ncbi:hypothetical protein ACJRPK_07405 [Aquimarina sp. 2-A2]|uniref:hypothetical protein n=1 Tax=Aquimarina sp. 2-A2 TaxID=3382644 RepID=UPI00387F03BF